MHAHQRCPIGVKHWFAGVGFNAGCRVERRVQRSACAASSSRSSLTMVSTSALPSAARSASGRRTCGHATAGWCNATLVSASSSFPAVASQTVATTREPSQEVIKTTRPMGLYRSQGSLFSMLSRSQQDEAWSRCSYQQADVATVQHRRARTQQPYTDALTHARL